MVKKAAVINDLSGFGKCSLTAAIPVLCIMGIQPCPLPTAILTNQTGFKNYYCHDFTDAFDAYEEMWQKNDAVFDGIYSGFVSKAEQIAKITRFIHTFKRSYTKILVDPVMGDHGKIYASYSAETCQKMCTLAKHADILTPNLTELCILTGTDFHSLKEKEADPAYLDIISEIAQKAAAHENQKIAVTGIRKDHFVYNGVFSKKERFFAKSKLYGTHFSGTGDLFASVLCAGMLNGEKIEDSVQKATVFLEHAIADTVQEAYDPNNGINFEPYLYLLAEKR